MTAPGLWWASRAIREARYRIERTLALWPGQAAGGFLVYPAWCGSSALFTKHCSERSCRRVASHKAANGHYHGFGTRYYCRRHAPSDAVEITDAMLRGPIRGHDCCETARHVAPI